MYHVYYYFYVVQYTAVLINLICVNVLCQLMINFVLCTFCSHGSRIFFTDAISLLILRLLLMLVLCVV